MRATAAFVAAGLSLAALCRQPAPEAAPVAVPLTPEAIQRAAVAALAVVPWDMDPSGWGALCSTEHPCDTIVVEPRIVQLPSQPPAFFVPERRPLAATLTQDRIPSGALAGRQLVLGDWHACSARTQSAAAKKSRTACVALAIAQTGTPSGDALSFALLTETVAKGLGWPRIRLARRRDAWQGTLVSNTTE